MQLTHGDKLGAGVSRMIRIKTSFRCYTTQLNCAEGGLSRFCFLSLLTKVSAMNVSDNAVPLRSAQ